MDKNSVLQYKNLFDGITHYIESEDAKEKIEVWFAVSYKPYWAMPDGRTFR